MNPGDPIWEFIDPTPNVYNMFMQFDKTYFWCKLGNRAVVRWSKRMYSCAGTCSYEGRGGLCDIALSEPLLKLRPRKDLVQTLLHEMIHAYLFISGGDRDRDGHGPQFQSHMHRINKVAGLNISIYHDFHDEVKLYKTHWWRCNGPCQNQHPYFGTVRRSSNRAPGPNDYWWNDHKRRCNGTFIKIKEPEKKPKKSAKKPVAGDITKINNKKISTTNKENTIATINTISTPKSSGSTKINGNTIVVTNTTHKTITPRPAEKPKEVWASKGYIINSNKADNDSDDVLETVRNVWVNKHLNVADNNKDLKKINKRASLDAVNNAPASKIPKIDLTDDPKEVSIDIMTSVINELYGEAYKLLQSNGKLYAIKDLEIVNCPICNIKVKNIEINRHVDECLNKDEILRISLENDQVNDSLEPKPSTSKGSFKKPSENDKTMAEIIDLTEESEKQCPCCSQTVKTAMDVHLEECLSFMDDNTTIPDEGEMRIKTEDDDIFDDSQIFNETGTKFPCPSCLDMIEQDDMNSHLGNCLQTVFCL